MNKKLITFALAAALALPSVSVLAQQNRGGGQNGGGRGGPPPEAITACEASAEGDACSFVGRNDDEIQGTCSAGREDKLDCKPEGRDENRPPRNN